ncbi:lysylphosphatidylglycerol synthase transmembrane domain-containing protein [Flavobacterium capsici]|uniref:Lysylphosphatidylglycerol synthase transmembrane domain-containing protein n=1 Tax=Flavobacterium capsici TaxID=3075618 RepID=A0AA96EX51_9FLAO|nr:MULTISPECIES: lysylphosphatidylglycerol synthase transmembrane domain-containing protein [unclassified Flavobacterium]WNM19791.1 lysylphosphatidylglycerol synthase transmembrane domain-containing protein [Flavobacterium sp. PMR2A8]WNM21180.1 lysylphosphatidylglycerol synthase transmembrane domain-containing protein [Flavobacterium sp. PMTSA4]
MKNSIRKWLTVLIPLLIGIGIIYYQFSTLTSEEIEKIKISFEKANYYYILLSLVIACLGYWSRAYRWKYALNHLGYQTKFFNNFFTVAVSYLVNLTVPRSGEISRAALLKKYEDVPFDKAFGTIVAERIVDLLIFLFFVCIGVISQYELIYKFLISKNVSLVTFLYFIIGAVILGVIFLLIWIYAEWKIIKLLKEKLSGLVEGMTTIFKMKDKWKYIFHSFFIWFSYLTMFYVAVFALPETSEISFDIVIMGFIFGSLAVGFSNGGLGAYPFSIALIFSLYGIANDIGTAFGWLVWTSQTILAVVLGLVSYLLLPIFNRNK